MKLGANVKLDNEDREQALRDLASRARPGLPVYFLAWLAVGSAFWFRWPRPIVSFALGGFIVLVSVFRSALVLDASRIQARDARLWHVLFRSTTLASALGFGVLTGLLIFDLGLGRTTVAALTITAAVGSMAIFVFAPDYPLIASFTAALNGPFALALALRAGNNSEAAVLFADLIFIGYCLLLGRRLNAEYWRAAEDSRLLRTRTQDLEGAREKLRASRDNLEVEVEKRTRELLAREADYRRIFEGAHDAILIFDPADERVLAVNEQACEVYGFPRQQFIGMSLKAISKDVERGEREIASTLQRGKHYGFETVQYRADGTEMMLEINASIIDYNGRPAILSLNRDVTLRRRAEELRLAKEAAERSDRARSEFLATVSHELRTPLAAIHGALMLMNAAPTPVAGDETRELIALATRNSERLGRLVNEILDFQKLDAGQMSFDLRPRPLLPLVKDAVDALQPYARERRVAISGIERIASDREDPAPIVNVDAGRLVQIMTNLLSNAIKFSNPEDLVRVFWETRQEEVRVTVADTGPGIPESFKGHVFEKFAQADSTDSRKVGGTGLGLSISKTLVEAMGGRIGFESEAGRGTRFFIDLPRCA